MAKAAGTGPGRVPGWTPVWRRIRLLAGTVHRGNPDPDDPRGRLPVRRTARIVLADDLDRILLFRFVDRDLDTPGRVWWGTVGGGVDRGESLAQAATRELFEETGLRVRSECFERQVARNQGRARFAGRELWFENHYYFLRVNAFELDVSGWQEVERASIAEHRWWSAAELAGTTELVHPPGLARILPDLLAGRLPEEPIEVG